MFMLVLMGVFMVVLVGVHVAVGDVAVGMFVLMLVLVFVGMQMFVLMGSLHGFLLGDRFQGLY